MHSPVEKLRVFVSLLSIAGSDIPASSNRSKARQESFEFVSATIAAAADAVEEAIVNAVTAADPGLGLSAYRDLLD